MPIFALTLNLRDDAGAIANYVEHHRHVWPEVLAAIRATGVEEIKIYLSGRRLFMVMTGPEGFDPGQAFAEYRRTPAVQRWEALMQTLQEQWPGSAPDEWWVTLKPIFDLRALPASTDAGP